MGVLGFVAAILFLSFVKWSRNDNGVKIKTDNEIKIMETDVLKELIENQNLNYELIDDSADCFVYKMVFQTEKGNLDVITTMKKQNPCFGGIYTYFPLDVPKGKRLKVSEFLTYLNDGLYIGNFEMSMASGTLRSKVSYCFDTSSTMSDNLFNSYLKNSYRLLEYYFDSIMTVIYSEKSPQEVYDEIMNHVDVSLN